MLVQTFILAEFPKLMLFNLLEDTEPSIQKKSVVN